MNEQANYTRTATSDDGGFTEAFTTMLIAVIIGIVLGNLCSCGQGSVVVAGNQGTCEGETSTGI